MENNHAEEFMDIALQEAALAMADGEVPVGAVIVKNGKIIAKGHNHRETSHDISSHAEIEVLREAGRILGTWDMNGCALYVTLEPCLMCAGAIEQSRLSTLVYGADDLEEGAVTSKRAIFDAKPSGLLIYRGVKAKECTEILQAFFKEKRLKN